MPGTRHVLNGRAPPPQKTVARERSRARHATRRVRGSEDRPTRVRRCTCDRGSPSRAYGATARRTPGRPRLRRRTAGAQGRRATRGARVCRDDQRCRTGNASGRAGGGDLAGRTRTTSRAPRSRNRVAPTPRRVAPSSRRSHARSCVREFPRPACGRAGPAAPSAGLRACRGEPQTRARGRRCRSGR